MGEQYVLDTQILVIASAGDQLSVDAAPLLHAIRERHFVALDQEGEILREYSRHMTPGTLSAAWFSQMSQRNKFFFYSHKLTRRHAAKLREIAFDPSDCKFVGVACCTPSRLLVAEESDYWQPAAAQCLQREMNINLLRIQAALARA